MYLHILLITDNGYGWHNELDLDIIYCKFAFARCTSIVWTVAAMNFYRNYVQSSFSLCFVFVCFVLNYDRLSNGEFRRNMHELMSPELARRDARTPKYSVAHSSSADSLSEWCITATSMHTLYCVTKCQPPSSEQTQHNEDTIIFSSHEWKSYIDAIESKHMLIANIA